MNDKELNQIMLKSIWCSMRRIEDTEVLKEICGMIAKKLSGGDKVAEPSRHALYMEFIGKLLSKATVEQLDIICRFVSSYLND